MDMIKVSERLKDTVGLIGVLWSFGFTLLMYITFLRAYYHPLKAITIYVNRFHEALIEWYVIPIVIGVIIWAIYWYVHEAILEDKPKGGWKR